MYSFFHQPLTNLSGVGQAIAKRLEKRQITCLGDLLLHLPKHYIDDRSPLSITQLQHDRIARTQGHIVARKSHGFGKKKVISITLSDEYGAQLQLSFFHSAFLGHDSRMAEGQQISVRGRVEVWQNKYQMQHPTWLPLSQFQPSYQPEYSHLAGLSSTRIQTLIGRAFEQMNAKMHSPLDAATDLSLYEALHQLHLPKIDHADTYHAAQQRIHLEELFVHLALMHQHRQEAKCPAIKLKPANLTQQLLDHLPWELTQAQQHVWQEISHDLSRGQRMHRLLQGDVGAGKTCIAALSMVCACDHQQQVALMAPTEVLAQQHAQSLSVFFKPLGLEVALLTSSTKKAQRRKILDQLQKAEINIIIGTHALISDDVVFSTLSLAIVDEQHRFGVRQRWALTEKGHHVHLLAMTATPIPRSLALALYGDMDLSIMKGLPLGRKPITTTLLDEQQLPQLAAGMQRIVQNKGLIYWVVPRIEEDEDGNSVEQRQQALQQHFPNWTILALHGRMKAEEKRHILDQFSRGDAQVLVSTTVIEVGVHISDARLMVIDDAQHYGLAQLHQLRGRVGRSDEQSYCVLIKGKSTSQNSLQRLQQLCHLHDGLALAELDLTTRGMGDALGIRQSGDMSFRLLDPVRDANMIQHYANNMPNFVLTQDMISFWKSPLSISD
ncbi:MAG: ATP-dependent DNA helicase RecG [Mariprofundaceae bacterium]|nr:ATP-dependent DNA helicase RecG [Mariprofundaceae bacterium]